MIRALEAHGRAMFGGEVVAPLSSSAKGKGREVLDEDDEHENDGWDDDGSDDQDDDEYDSQDELDSEGEGGEDGQDDDVELVPTGDGGPRLPEVVYAPKKFASSESSRADYKAFMVR